MKFRMGNMIITDRESHNGKEALVIKRGTAFPPSHITTELCLKLMEQTFASRSIGALLDIGCGTGILALAGLKLGAERAIALDIAEEAILATKENLRRNNLEHRMDLILGSVEGIKGNFDLIVANIHFPILIGMATNFKNLTSEKGTLILSGFYDIDFYHLESVLNKLGFRSGEVLYKSYVMPDLPPSMSSTFGAAIFLKV